MKETIERLAQIIGFDLAGLVTQQFKDKYEKKKYAGCICDDYFGYQKKRDEVFSRYVSRYFKKENINTNIIPPITNQTFQVIDDEYETNSWRW